MTPKKWRVNPDYDVNYALRDPIGPAPSNLARQSRTAVIVTCDKTRGLPSHLTIPPMLEELTKGGLNADDVMILVATGLHKDETMSDVEERIDP